HGRGGRGTALDRPPGLLTALRLPRREPPPSLRSGDYSRRELQRLCRFLGHLSPTGGRVSPDLDSIRPVSPDSSARVDLRQAPGDGAILTLAGALDVSTAAEARREVVERLSGTRVSSLQSDASGIDHGDVSGMAVLYEIAHGRFTPGISPTVRGLKPEFENLLKAFPPPDALDSLEPHAVRRGLTEEVGAATLSMFRDLRAQLTFIGAVVQGFAAALRRPRLMRWHEVGVVFEKAGVNALPIVSLISILMGLVIAFEAAQPLAMFGAQIFIADMIGLVMVREFSPIFTAIILAGRPGAAFLPGRRPTKGK